MKTQQMMESGFTIKAKEVANELGKTVQEVYSYLDISKQKHAILKKPILTQGKDWDYIKGRIFLSEKSVEVLRDWVKVRSLKPRTQKVEV